MMIVMMFCDGVYGLVWCRGGVLFVVLCIVIVCGVMCNLGKGMNRCIISINQLLSLNR